MKYIQSITTLFWVSLSYSFAQNANKYDIQVSSAAIQNLYRDCANLVNINVPDLCNDYNPKCTATNADIQQSTESKRKFMIAPKGNRCTLSVFNHISETSEQLLGEMAFSVLEPPKPTMEILLNGQKISSTIQAGKGSSLFIKIVPEFTFSTTMPQDAKYCIGKVSFFVQNCFSPINIGEMDVSNRDISNGITIPIPSDAFQMGSGRKLFIEISDIYRINYKGEKKVDNRMTLYEKTIAVILL